MTIPISMITQANAADLLANTYTTLDRAMPGLMEQPPCLLLVLPAVWNNRYQTLLYSEAGPRRYAILGINDTEKLKYVSWPGPVILHAHWFAGLFKNCENEAEAFERFKIFCDDILIFRDRTGAKLMWTAHNVFPHGNSFPETFLKLRQWLFETFDFIHVMQEQHIPMLEQAFKRKAPPHITVPHMLYDGSHPDCITPAAAKIHYGIAPDTFVFGYFGSIQPYKNLEAMLVAFNRIVAGSQYPVAAIVGGVPSHPPTVQRLLQGWSLNPRVHLLMKTISDDEIQYIHRASDVMVLPYHETLNSGAAFMAASFGIPFIMPGGLSSSGMDGLGLVGFDVTKPEALESTMHAVLNGKRGTVHPLSRTRSTPRVVSRTFFDEIDRIIGRRP
ncbi:hypothetical protein EGJ57_23650 [Brucella anthropi]|uniref:glycosyltransferase n=1 Tax=Brucella anthropi TaxID=529 RepID=UPI000F68200C|nr:glycosyltransferase [Brucella anthropi]RRY15844.1 hypothetical protein EGJ57_23650 [Brucella anthropi]